MQTFLYQASNAALPDLSDAALQTAQDELDQLRVLIIDEKSFVGGRMLDNIDCRLRQIKDRRREPFGGVSVILLGDFKQLSPVSDVPLYKSPKEKMTPFQRMGIDTDI